jgi:hypothetical protein
MTRQEFEAKQVSMLRMFAEIMNADRARRDAETASMLRTIYGSMNDRQLSNYEELRGRIEAVGLGLMAEQSKTNERLDLMQQTVLDSLGLADDQENRNGGEKK